MITAEVSWWLSTLTFMKQLPTDMFSIAIVYTLCRSHLRRQSYCLREHDRGRLLSRQCLYSLVIKMRDYVIIGFTGNTKRGGSSSASASFPGLIIWRRKSFVEVEREWMTESMEYSSQMDILFEPILQTWRVVTQVVMDIIHYPVMAIIASFGRHLPFPMEVTQHNK